MNLDPSLQHFGLQAEDLSLRILNCSEQEISNLPSVTTVNPKLLPSLPYGDQSFNLALCSSFLFKETLTEAFHLAALLELARVAGEVRVYPLTDKQGHPSVHLGPILQALQQKGLGVELRQVSNTVTQGNAVLRFWTESCALSDFPQKLNPSLSG